MGKPISWKGERMRSHLLTISRNLSAIETRIIHVLKAGYVDKDDFIQAFGDMLEFVLMAKSSTDVARDVMRQNYHDSRSPNEIDDLRYTIEFLQQVLEQMEASDDDTA